MTFRIAVVQPICHGSVFDEKNVPEPVPAAADLIRPRPLREAAE